MPMAVVQLINAWQALNIYYVFKDYIELKSNKFAKVDQKYYKLL